MTDRPPPYDGLVEHLRKRKAFGLNGYTWMLLNEPDWDCQAAAARIEALEAALRKIAHGYLSTGQMAEIACAALAPGQDK